ncbi:MAG: hypothetical protein KF817_14340 [Phycisphaeraceae bacterium]|nr:hypothetical protein [Phycisphaeraceae bacterium]
MAQITRLIGLSLGADLCWPICYEEILARLNLRIPTGSDTVRLETERVTIEPFDLEQPCRYAVVLDRVTHWYHTSREWIKKAILLNDLYVLNNPWAIQSMEKQTTYAAMMRLGMPIPKTWMVPPKEYEPSTDLQPTLDRYARIFDLRKVGEAIGYPLFMKPYDGGAWVGVSRIENGDQLVAAYEASGKRLMHLQKAVDGWDLFVRALGVGPQVRLMRYNPDAPLHARYEVAFDFLTAEEAHLLGETVLTINAFFGWDFNSCEALRSEGTFHPIDFANACPDSQVTSLHFHFPWLVKAVLRWSIFCAVTRRPMRMTLNWKPFLDIAGEDIPYRERLRKYAAVARAHFETDRFEEFCTKHLGHLDEVALEFFGTDQARDAVRLKVQALFPAHEVDSFTDHFWGLIQFWRSTEADRLGRSGTPKTLQETT